MQKSYENVILSVDKAGIALCTFNRPEKRNALNGAMVNDVHQVLTECAENNDVRVLMFTGSGEKSFISGADIAELKARSAQDTLRQVNSRLFLAVERFAKPTIAAINGYALGGGLEMALACDLRVCSRSAKLGQPEVGLGIIPGAGACYRLPRVIGVGKAKEIIFSGRILNAEESLAWGLVNRLADNDKLIDTAYEFAREVAKQSPLALQFAKAVVQSSFDPGYGNIMLEGAVQAVLASDSEKDRRMQAFLERKK